MKSTLLASISVAALAACSSGSSGTTGGACLPNAADCSAAASACCAGLTCSAGLCLSESGSGNGNGTGTGATTSSGGTSATATHTSTTSGNVSNGTASATATATHGTGSSGTTSGAIGSVGSSTTGGANSSGTTGTTTTYCNGIELEDSEGGDVNVSTYPVTDEIRLGCLGSIESLLDGGSTSLSTLGGILDNNTDSTQAGLLTVDPAGCDDLGVTSPPIISTTSYDPPSGGFDVEDARANALDGGTVYGIVTWISSPFYSASTAKGHSGTLYLQDDSLDPQSGIAVYIGGSFATANGITGYPDSGLARGDVVAISNLYWSPYAGTAAVDTQDQLAYTAGSTVTVLATEALPDPITVDAADIASGNEQSYVGMRVTVQNTPLTVINACAPALVSQ